MRTYVAKYWRYQKECSQEFTTFEEAVRFLREGEDDGHMSADSIKLPSGTVLNRDDLYIHLNGREKSIEPPVFKTNNAFYKKIVWWETGNQRSLYGEREKVVGKNPDGSENTQTVLELISHHDARAEIANYKEIAGID